MSNPLMQAMGGGSPFMGGGNAQMMQAAKSIKQMMGMFQAMKNPQQAIMQMAQQNPQINAVLQMCQNRDPKEVFEEQCKAHGMDPDATIKQIQQMLS